MDKTYFFLSGLPRAGGTLLSALLNQHPDIHSGPDSPLAALMSWNLKVLDNNEQNLMYPKEGVDERIIKSVANAYYEDVSEQYIFENGGRDYLLKINGLSKNNILKKIHYIIG